MLVIKWKCIIFIQQLNWAWNDDKRGNLYQHCKILCLFGHVSRQVKCDFFPLIYREMIKDATVINSWEIKEYHSLDLFLRFRDYMEIIFNDFVRVNWKFQILIFIYKNAQIVLIYKCIYVKKTLSANNARKN